MTEISPTGIYTPAEAAESVGVKLTFIKTQIKEGRLTAYRLGAKVLRIKGSDLLAWFEGQRIPCQGTAQSVGKLVLLVFGVSLPPERSVNRRVDCFHKSRL